LCSATTSSPKRAECVKEAYGSKPLHSAHTLHKKSEGLKESYDSRILPSDLNVPPYTKFLE